MPRKRRETNLEPEQLAALLQKPELWDTLDADTLAALVQIVCAVYGSAPDPGKLAGVAALYRTFQERASPDVRKATEPSIVGVILHGHSTAAALLPFLAFDDDVGVISSAALDFAVLHDVSEGEDPFIGPRSLLEMATPESGLPEPTRAGILTGLAVLGDRRLLLLLDRCWEWLGPEGRQTLTRATSGFASAGLIDFFISWLEQTDDERDFGGILGTLCRLPSIADGGVVRDIERAFPATSSPTPIRLLRTWTFSEYYQEVRPRLDRVAHRESEPKYTPYVARYWGGC